MQFQIGEWILDINTEATKEHYKKIELHRYDNADYRRHSAHQTCRNYAAYCYAMPPEEKAFFDSLGINPEYGEAVLGFRMDEECNYYIHGNYYVIGSIIKKPADIIWNGQPDIFIGKYQSTFIHPEWLSCSPYRNIPEKYIGIHFCVEGIPWLLEEQCEANYCYDPPKSIKIKRAEKIERELQNVLEDINSNFRKMTEQESRDYMREWFERVVPADKREEAKIHCFSSPIMGGYLWHAFNFGFAAYEEVSHAANLYDAFDHGSFVLLMNSEKIGFVVENGQGLISNIVNEYNDIIITDIDFKWTYVHTHESYCGPYFAFLS